MVRLNHIVLLPYHGGYDIAHRPALEPRGTLRGGGLESGTERLESMAGSLGRRSWFGNANLGLG